MAGPAERLVMKLQGKQSNFTGFLGTYKFEDGFHVCVIPADRVEKRIRVLNTFYGAEVYKDGASQVHEDPGSRAPAAVPGGGGPDGSGSGKVPADDGSGTDAGGKPAEGSVSSGDGQQDTRDDGTKEFADRLLKAVTNLDPTNDEHWTADGRPRIDEVEKAYGSAGVTRADVDAIAPGYTRPTQ